jgi:predicted tellurium resistance membrane protein TerC
LFDIGVFASPETWVQLITLVFLELVLGVDNLVFIAITTDRLPDDKKVIGRRFGLMAAMLMRIALLCAAAWVISLNLTLFTLPFELPGMDAQISGKDLILLVGGGYLVFKGIQELIEKLSLKEEQRELLLTEDQRKHIGLPQAIATIAAMDVIFSLDSVITAIGMVDVVLIMIIAVMLAVIVMILFANPISEFINANPEVKILALVFIVAVGLKLVIEALGFELHIPGVSLDGLDLMLYFAMLFSLILAVLQMSYNSRLAKLKARHLEESGYFPAGTKQDQVTRQQGEQEGELESPEQCEPPTPPMPPEQSGQQKESEQPKKPKQPVPEQKVREK